MFRCLELRIPPLLVLGGAMAGLWLACVLWPAPTLSAYGAARTTVATVLGIAGGLASLAGVRAFRRVGTTTNPLAPETTSAMVVQGIYRHTRNPMYLGFLLALLGWAIYLGHALGPVIAWLFVAYLNRFQIAPEERFLAAKFGASYRDYCAQVRRWL
jgi:protein-S-isoprenylcysteine O-methyltransferase Ste14